jgi:hypothetical protein
MISERVGTDGYLTCPYTYAGQIVTGVKVTCQLPRDRMTSTRRVTWICVGMFLTLVRAARPELLLWPFVSPATLTLVAAVILLIVAHYRRG